MNSCAVIQTVGYRKSLRRVARQGKNLKKLDRLVRKLVEGEVLSPKYRDHKLEDSRRFKGCRECHIEPDWLLVYRKEDDMLILTLVETGSHSDLF